LTVPSNTDASSGAISGQAVFAGLLAAFVGFASSFAVVLQGLRGAGATEEQAASGLLAVSVACGLTAIILSTVTRLPVAIAWSTPGAALLATTATPAGGFAESVGAFVICALAFIVAGLWKPLGRAVAAIPSHLANAMLAGVLVGLCFAPFQAIAQLPVLGASIVIAWVVGGLFHRLLAVPAALGAFTVCVVATSTLPPGTNLTELLLQPIPLTTVTPVFTLTSMFSIAVPLFLVTMASQNIAGVAVMRSYGYATNPGPWFATTGVFSALATTFGGHAVNLAAITAAMCAGNDAHPEPGRRYWAAISMGVGMIALGLTSGAVIAVVSLSPPLLIQGVAGLALVGAFCNATYAAFEKPETREISAITFLFAASGVSVAGVSGAFWGLVLGAALDWIRRRRGAS
jgi:benzoate membrane transport protein